MFIDAVEKEMHPAIPAKDPEISAMALAVLWWGTPEAYRVFTFTGLYSLPLSPPRDSIHLLRSTPQPG
jgi:hypothetical protein